MGEGDETKSETTAVPQETAAHVAVKPPAFDENSVARWFKILESMFITSKISTTQTKFHHTLSNLPVNVANKLTDAVIDSANYETLKKALVAQFTKPTPELFENLISSNKIAFTKPTEYLIEIRKIGEQLNVNEDFLKIKFLKSLPDHIRPIIVSKESLSLDEMAHAADCIMEYEAGVVGEACASVSHSNRRAGSRRQSESNYNDELNYNSRPNYNSEPNYNSRPNYNGGPNFDTRSRAQPKYNDQSIPYNVRAFHGSQRPQVCRAHLYFGNNAKYCKPWCIMADKRLPMRPNSRSASPAPHSGN